MTRQGRLVRRLLAVPVTLSVLVLGGCGDDEVTAQPEARGSSTTSAGPTDEASEAAADEEPVAAAAGEEISAQAFAAIARGSFEIATSAKVSLTIGGGAGMLFSAEGEADYESEPVAMVMTMSIARLGDFEVRLVDGVMYVKPAGSREQFMVLDLDDPDSLVGPIVARMDASAVLEQLERGIAKAVFAGQEDIDGEQLDHYTVTADTADMFGYFPPKTLARLPETLDYEWYIDDEGMFRRFTTELWGGRKTVEIELSFDDWGADVDVEAPPSVEVTTMPGTGS